MTATLNYRQIPDAVANREPFQGNSMSGQWYIPGDYVPMGRLPEPERILLKQVLTDAERFWERVYVVYSYGTPIAWGMGVDRTLYIPDVKYSVTTSKQQALLRRTQ